MNAATYEEGDIIGFRYLESFNIYLIYKGSFNKVNKRSGDVMETISEGGIVGLENLNDEVSTKKKNFFYEANEDDVIVFLITRASVSRILFDIK